MRKYFSPMQPPSCYLVQVMQELLREEEAEYTKYNTVSSERDLNKYIGSPQIISARYRCIAARCTRYRYAAAR